MGLKQPLIRKPRTGWMINSPYLEMYLMQERRRFLWVPNGNLVMVNLKVYQNRIIPQALYVVVVNLKCSLKKNTNEYVDVLRYFGVAKKRIPTLRHGLEFWATI